MFKLVKINGALYYQLRDGRTVPVLAGADDNNGGGDGGDGKGDGDKGGGSGDGKGGDGKPDDKGGKSDGDDKDKGGKGDGKDDASDGLTPEQLRAQLTRANSDAAKYRTERNADREKVAELDKTITALKVALGIEEGDKDPEKLKQALAAKDEELRQVRMQSVFHRVAAKAGADVELAWAVASTSGKLADIKSTGDELEKELGDMVASLVTSHPKLKVETTATRNGRSEDGGNGSKGKTDMNALIRQRAGVKVE